MNEVLLISVGGSPEPVIVSIIKNQKPKVIFFASGDSRNDISQKVLPRLCEAGQCPDHEFVITPDHESLGDCVAVLLRQAPAAMRKLGERDSWPSCIDFTGGTKVMSSALVWASSKYAGNFSYIGGFCRNKNGVGVVINGSEKYLIQENPWDKVAYFELETAMLLANRGQFASAAEILDGVMAKVSAPAEQKLFECLVKVFRGFHAWDIFDHKEAVRRLEPGIRQLQDIAGAHLAANSLLPFAEQTRRLVDNCLRNLNGNAGMFQVHDLLANAWRRAEIEHKYEDAVARCYSAFEKAAKFILTTEFKIDNSKARPEQLPESIRENFKNKYAAAGNPEILQFGLLPSFELLRELKHPTAECFWQRPNICDHLQERNNSILAHGSRPLKKNHFDDLFNDVLAVFAITPDVLPQFPKFETVGALP